ncbi:complement binding protein [Cotia virus SPAn232]|uniref:Complement control protein C3 n=2 Tax=Cotia virus TaxID=39444 RepID=H6TAH9_9POXV|nr:complement binding protein [Cotia virus SPAn232]AFB76916.1 complement binding protein [Cotia virus SPAn232]AIT70641.1 complement binding protein [Cotia virus]
MNVSGVVLITLLKIIYVLSCCNVPTSPVNMKFKQELKSQYNVGDSVGYECLLGYRKQRPGSIYAKCTGNGWKLNNQCVKRRCSTPRDIDNGQVDINGVEFGSSIVYSCNRGYSLIGESTSYCELGYDGSMVWSHDAPICESIKCGSPPEVTNGHHSGYDDVYTDGTVLTYSCNSGYSLIGTTGIVCNNGQWTDTPTCMKVKCPYPTVQNAYVTSVFKRSYSLNDRVYFTCKDGYTLSGSYSSTCSSDNTWKPELPTCVRVKD